ncbi:HEPN domain-containing protein [Vibrio metschnikovii]|uniref:HEPN domain-containing protein n=1 Tax=Vibrio metschnikovii TaxID=28172 RepID=UPI001C2F1968|nr:HEPN domain-containing protein [Vibrio metschnikovii]
MLTFNTLKQRHRAERDQYPSALSIRVHRALSWLNKAEQCSDDDSAFLFLWIAFNSAYAQDFEQKSSFGERGLFQEFLSKLVELDKQQQLSAIVWEQYSGPIRCILDNEFILQAYWDYQAGRIDQESWKQARSKAKIAANQALSQNDTASVLSIVFARLYTLRNQMIHGGATFGSSANRQQLRDCTSLLQHLVPTLITIMMNSKQAMWGEPVYPLVDNSRP